MLSATNSLNLLAQICDQRPTELGASVQGDLVTPGLLFLPYLAGEPTPHNDALIRSAFIGLSAETTPTDMTRAVFEGVAFGLRDCAEVLSNAGAHADEFYLLGGGATSPYWRSLMATTLKRDLLYPTEGAFGPAQGAARLAIAAMTGEVTTSTFHLPKWTLTVCPNEALIGAFMW